MDGDKQVSSSEPPDHDKEPKHYDQKYDVPKPSATLARCHVVHPSEGSRQYSRRFSESVILNKKTVNSL
jgi:hypothetical protein